MAGKKNRMSREGYNSLVQKLDELKYVKMPEVVERIKEARAQGDLSENAEYEEAMNDQARLDAEIKEIESSLKNAEVVSDDDISTDEINFGSLIKVKDLEFDEILEFKIVGASEADPENNKISDVSPVGAAALKKKVGDIFEAETPGGIVRMEVLEINIPEAGGSKDNK